jgi:hypothetical protein
VHIQPATKAASSNPAPKSEKKKRGGFVGIAAALIIAILAGGAIFSNIGKERPPEIPPTTPPVKEDPNIVTVNAANISETLAPSMDAYRDTSDAIEDFGKRLAQSGDAEAARAVYSMVPKAELSQAAKEKSEKIETSTSGIVQIYNKYKDMKHMFTSIYGEEGDR